MNGRILPPWNRLWLGQRYPDPQRRRRQLLATVASASPPQNYNWEANCNPDWSGGLNG